MNDKTIIYYTANCLPEKFARRVRNEILKAELPIISVSQKPLDFGENICVGNIGKSYINIYKQMLIGAKAAKTENIAFCEDDVLYSKAHFDFNPNCFAYDANKWSIYTWTIPVFSMKYDRAITNTSLICPRNMFIEAMEERFAKYPENPPLHWWAEPGRYEKQLGVKVQPTQVYTAKESHIVFSHPEAIGYQYMGNRKKLGDIRSIEIPYWGRAEEVQKWYL